jgi:hypothetical protein
LRNEIGKKEKEIEKLEGNSKIMNLQMQDKED